MKGGLINRWTESDLSVCHVVVSTRSGAYLLNRSSEHRKVNVNLSGKGTSPAGVSAKRSLTELVQSFLLLYRHLLSPINIRGVRDGRRVKDP